MEIRHEDANAPCPAVLISCSHADELAGVARCIDLALRLGHTRLVVDLSERPEAEADLLSILHRAGQRARARGGWLCVVSADPNLHRLLDVTLLSLGLGVYETREEALAG